jgi:hypothetical protein
VAKVNPLVLAVGGTVAAGLLVLIIRGAWLATGARGVAVSPPANRPPTGPPYVASGPLPKGLTPQFVAIANKYAALRQLPLAWVLATILNESSGNPGAVGDQGRSIGLMQVNADAHASRLAGQGLTKDSLFDPEINIRIGTEIMAEFYKSLMTALAGRQPPADIGVLLRLMYRGPSLVLKAIRENPPRNPTPTFPGGPASEVAWNSALNRVSAIV